MSISLSLCLPGERGSLAACAGVCGEGNAPFNRLKTEEQLGVTEPRQVTAREGEHGRKLPESVQLDSELQ